MRADVILGFDPVPGDSARLVVLSDVLRRAMRGLVEARLGLDRLGRTGSVWDGVAGVPIATVLLTYSRRLSVLEEAILDCMRSVDRWREGVDRRQTAVADIVAAVADLAGQPEAQDRRTRLIAAARELRAEHDRAARELAGAFEHLSATVAGLGSPDEDLAGELDRSLQALTIAVEEWIDGQGEDLIRTAVALSDVAGLTTVLSELVGIAALGRSPGEAAGVSEIVARSPGSHRLIGALRRQWQQAAPATLPTASFAGAGAAGLGDRLEGAAGSGE